MKLGDWIFTAHNGNKITGFITDFENGKASIHVTIPKNYGSVQMDISEIYLHNDPVIWMDDIPSLIDLSLQIKDEEWFRKWVHELSIWKPASELENLISRQ